MTEGSLYPAYAEIEYHSSYAPHVMIIPTKAWNPGSTYGDFETWAGGSIAADTMIEALTALMLPFFPSTVHLDGFTVFTKADLDAQAIPRAFKSLSGAGSAASSWSKATQATLSAKTTAGSLAKITLMDVATANSFDRITQASVSSDLTAFLDEWFADTNGWSARIDGRPYYFLQAAYTLNEKLRRQYHMN